MKLVWIGFSSFHKNRLVFKLFFNPCLEDSSTTPHLLQPTWQQACSWIRLRVLCCHETNTTSSPDGTSSTTCHARSGVDRHCYGLLWGFTVLICTLACLREDAWQNREADNACVWYARFLLSRNRRWRLFFQNPGTDISSCWLGGLFCVCILCIYFPGFRNSELKLCSYMFLQLMADVLDMPVGGLLLFPTWSWCPQNLGSCRENAASTITKPWNGLIRTQHFWCFLKRAKQRKKRKLNSFCQMPVVVVTAVLLRSGGRIFRRGQ
jgi:hypothetical protein